MTLREKSSLARILWFIYRKLTLNYDYFIVITGDEGVGKSRGIFLNIIDYWYKTILGKQIPKGCFGIDLKDFVKGLKKGEIYDFRGLDEAGDKLDTQDYANHLNKILYQSYTIIREKKLFSCVVLPSIFDLNPRFRKRRVRLLIHVRKRINNICKDCGYEFVEEACPKCKSTNFKRGYVVFHAYSRKRLRKILALNEKRFVKTLNVGVIPTASGRVGVYHGELEEPYSKMKLQKMTETMNGLEAETNKRVGENPRRCIECGSLDSRYINREDMMVCRACGNRWSKQEADLGREGIKINK